MAATKKSAQKKVQTPIDERETFVSLQRNFADSDITVGEKLRILYDLQKADNDIEALVQLRGELPAEVSALEEEIAGLDGKIAAIAGEIAACNAAIEDAGEKIVEHDADIDKYQKQLENISNSREYDSINKELENTRLLRQIDQKNITEAREKILALKEDTAAVAERKEIREQDLAAKKEELDKIVSSTADQEKALRARRDDCAARLADERTLSAYDRIRASVHNHLAVVPVYGGNACGGCFSTITPQRLVEIASGNKLIICEHCGRIIVNAESESAE